MTLMVVCSNLFFFPNLVFHFPLESPLVEVFQFVFAWFLTHKKKDFFVFKLRLWIGFCDHWVQLLRSCVCELNLWLRNSEFMIVVTPFTSFCEWSCLEVHFSLIIGPSNCESMIICHEETGCLLLHESSSINGHLWMIIRTASRASGQSKFLGIPILNSSLVSGF